MVQAPPICPWHHDARSTRQGLQGQGPWSRKASWWPLAGDSGAGHGGGRRAPSSVSLVDTGVGPLLKNRERPSGAPAGPECAGWQGPRDSGAVCPSQASVPWGTRVLGRLLVPASVTRFSLFPGYRRVTQVCLFLLAWECQATHTDPSRTELGLGHLQYGAARCRSRLKTPQVPRRPSGSSVRLQLPSGRQIPSPPDSRGPQVSPLGLCSEPPLWLSPVPVLQALLTSWPPGGGVPGTPSLCLRCSR